MLSILLEVLILGKKQQLECYKFDNSIKDFSSNNTEYRIMNYRRYWDSGKVSEYKEFDSVCKNNLKTLSYFNHNKKKN